MRSAGDGAGHPDRIGRAQKAFGLAPRQLAWARRDGFRKFIEEKELLPVTRTRAASGRVLWRLMHGVQPGDAVPVWIVGVQRSGTNLLMRSLKSSPEIKVYNENHRRAFEDFRLRDDEQLRALIASCRQSHILFKPLCDIHRADDFWHDGFSEVPSQTIWSFRDVDGRVRSSVARFGDIERKYMHRVADGTAGGSWYAAGMGPEQHELVRSFAWDRESPETAAALFWYLRNDLLFRAGLHERQRVTPVSYRALVEDPTGTLGRVESALGLTVRLGDRLEPLRRKEPPRLALASRVRHLCDEMEARLTGFEQEIAAR